jgi:CheY-like chemotaxis protein
MSTSRDRILIMDDSPLMLAMAKDALESAGFAVTVVTNLSDLELEKLREPPDLILMDVQMPEIFGDDIAMVLRKVRGLRIPIYLFSNLDRDELSRRASEADIDGFICKRDGIETLVHSVQRILTPGAAPRRDTAS